MEDKKFTSKRLVGVEPLKLKIDSGVFNINLDPMSKYVDFNITYAKYFPMRPGQNHHMLLAYLASQLSDGMVVGDIGTLLGQSAVALAYNANIRVITIDTTNHLPAIGGASKTIRDVENISIVIGSCFDNVDMFIKCPLLLFDIDPHNGTDEKQFLDLLLAKNYKGIVIFDDIHYDTGMEKFWNEIELKKFDVTNYGHHSGTGIVVCDEKSFDLEIG